MSTRALVVLLGCCWVGACASPPLTLYTLGTPPELSETRPLGLTPVVIAVSRVTIPDELDTEDIAVRDGSTLHRSSVGRWASRLSLGITDRVTQRLAERTPGALVTDRPFTDTPTDRILINVGRLDVTSAGRATLDADWLVIPRDAAASTQRDRGQFTATGPVATDHDVVTLIGSVVDSLAKAIVIDRR